MAKNMQPIAKRCHALGISPAVMGYAKKTTHRNPGSQMRRKKGEYALQLQEKQKVKFVYGILEKQFRSYYEKATRMPGRPGENLAKIFISALAPMPMGKTASSPNSTMFCTRVICCSSTD